MSLPRPCLGCGQTVRGKPRCIDCTRTHDRRKNQRRPDLHADHHERERRRRAVADHRAIVGDWCPGWERRPAHPSADLTADHVREVRLGGHITGRLVVRCRSCNSAKAAAAMARAARMLGRFPNPNGTPPTPRPSNFGTNAADLSVANDRSGPVVA